MQAFDCASGCGFWDLAVPATHTLDGRHDLVAWHKPTDDGVDAEDKAHGRHVPDLQHAHGTASP